MTKTKAKKVRIQRARTDIINRIEMDVNTYLDSLPDDTTEIKLNSKGLTVLPDLSRFTNLQELSCVGNNLTALPDDLPNSIEILNCSCNKLTLLPNTLPNNLKQLYCYYNQLTSLPDTLPNTLKQLNCMQNELTTLPDNLPDSIEILTCYANNIQRFPNTLPTSLKLLNPDFINYIYPEFDFHNIRFTEQKREYIIQQNVQNFIEGFPYSSA